MCFNPAFLPSKTIWTLWKILFIQRRPCFLSRIIFTSLTHPGIVLFPFLSACYQQHPSLFLTHLMYLQISQPQLSLRISTSVYPVHSLYICSLLNSALQGPMI